MVSSNYCLPGYLVDKFKSALENGDVDPNELAQMSPTKRRALLDDLLGKDHGETVNALFESKLLLKNQQLGFARWIDQLEGIKPEVKRDMVSKVQKLKNVLNPTQLEDFKADLAKDKLGFNVTAEQAKDIFDTANKVDNLRTQMEDTPDFSKERENYGRAVQEMRDKFLDMMPDNRSGMDHLIDWWNVENTAETGAFHLSAPVVQLWGMAGKKHWFGSFPQMVQSLFSPEASAKFNAMVLGDRDFAKMNSVVKFGGISDKLPMSEETSPLLLKWNKALYDKFGIPDILGANSRAFADAQNYVKYKVMKDYLKGADLAGLDTSLGSPELESLGSVVNNFTGRSALLDQYHQLNPLLRFVFWTPAKMAATIQKFNPDYYRRLTPFARREAVKNLIGSVAMTGAVMTLAQVTGFAQVEWNPNENSIGKLRLFNGAEMEIPGADITYLRLIYRLGRNGYLNASNRSDEIPDYQATRSEVGQFLRGKFSSMTGNIFDGFWGTDPVGRPFSVTQEARDHLYPIFVSNTTNYLQSNPDNINHLLPLLFTLFGVGLQSPRPAEMTGGLGFDQNGSNQINFWGEPSNPFSPAPRNDIDREAQRLKFPLHLPLDRINGQKLTHQQYVNYITSAGQQMKQIMTDTMNDPSWNETSDKDKLRTLKAARDKGRFLAQKAVGADAIDTDNDITQKAYDKKFGVQ